MILRVHAGEEGRIGLDDRPLADLRPVWQEVAFSFEAAPRSVRIRAAVRVAQREEIPTPPPEPWE